MPAVARGPWRSRRNAPPRFAYRSRLSAGSSGSSGGSSNPSMSTTVRAAPSSSVVPSPQASDEENFQENFRQVERGHHHAVRRFPRVLHGWPLHSRARQTRCAPTRQMVLAKGKLPDDARDPDAVVKFQRPVRAASTDPSRSRTSSFFDERFSFSSTPYARATVPHASLDVSRFSTITSPPSHRRSRNWRTKTSPPTCGAWGRCSAASWG